MLNVKRGIVRFFKRIEREREKDYSLGDIIQVYPLYLIVRIELLSLTLEFEVKTRN